MHNQPIRDERILEAIEACRPGSDDVADPALAYLAAELEADPELEELYGRIQRVDELLAAEFRDLPVPVGLEQRLLDRLAAARAEELVAADSEKAVRILAEDRPAVAPPRPRRVSRRWLAAAMALTAAAVVLVGVTVWLQLHGPEPYTKQLVLDDAVAFFLNDFAGGAHFVSDPNHPPPDEYPISNDVPEVPGMQWRQISGFLRCDGVAYDIDGETYGMPGTRATFYVVKLTVPDLPFRPPRHAEPTTGGCSASVWQEGDLLYVLVLDGDSSVYGHFYHRILAGSRRPIA